MTLVELWILAAVATGLVTGMVTGAGHGFVLAVLGALLGVAIGSGPALAVTWYGRWTSDRPGRTDTAPARPPGKPRPSELLIFSGLVLSWLAWPFVTFFAVRAILSAK